MKIKSLISAQKDRFTSNFNKASLANTKGNIAGAIHPLARQEKLQDAIASKDARIALRQKSYERAYMLKTLVVAGASEKNATEIVNSYFASKASRGGVDTETKFSRKLDLSGDRATLIFNNLLDSTRARSQLREEFEAKKSSHSNNFLYILENNSNAKQADKAGRKHLAHIKSIAEKTDSTKANLAAFIGSVILNGATFKADSLGTLNFNFNTSDRTPLNERDQKSSSVTSRGVDVFQQQKSIAKLKLGITYDKAGKGLIEAKRGFLKTSANVAGSLVAASRPVAAVAASPVLLAAGGVSAVAAGTAVGVAAVAVGTIITGALVTAGAATGVAAGTAAVGAPLWAIGTTLSDGITGGPGVAGRSKNIARGNEIRKNLGLPSKETVSNAKSTLGGMFKNFGKGFSVNR